MAQGLLLFLEPYFIHMWFWKFSIADVVQQFSYTCSTQSLKSAFFYSHGFVTLNRITAPDSKSA